MTEPTLWTDGNALAGPLHDIFSVDLTAADVGCANCGWTGSMAAVRVFGNAPQAPGVVARCPSCEQVLLREVRGPGRAWLDLRGLTYLQVAVPDA